MHVNAEIPAILRGPPVYKRLLLTQLSQFSTIITNDISSPAHHWSLPLRPTILLTIALTALSITAAPASPRSTPFDAYKAVAIESQYETLCSMTTANHTVGHIRHRRLVTARSTAGELETAGPIGSTAAFRASERSASSTATSNSSTPTGARQRWTVGSRPHLQRSIGTG